MNEPKNETGRRSMLCRTWKDGIGDEEPIDGHTNYYSKCSDVKITFIYPKNEFLSMKPSTVNATGLEYNGHRA